MYQSYQELHPATLSQGPLVDLGNIIKLPTVEVQAQADRGLQTTLLVTAGLLVLGAIAVALINRDQ